jgi:hypothetical protein
MGKQMKAGTPQQERANKHGTPMHPMKPNPEHPMKPNPEQAKHMVPPHREPRTKLPKQQLESRDTEAIPQPSSPIHPSILKVQGPTQQHPKLAAPVAHRVATPRESASNQPGDVATTVRTISVSPAIKRNMAPPIKSSNPIVIFFYLLYLAPRVSFAFRQKLLIGTNNKIYISYLLLTPIFI